MSSTLATASAAAFTAIFVAKYTKTAVGCYTYLTFKPRPVSDTPKYTSKDVSVVIPTTYGKPKELLECVQAILKTGPSKIFVVCSNTKVKKCKELLNEDDHFEITVLGVKEHNKRDQILTALDYVESDIVVLADDDVFWPDAAYLNLLLAIFEDDQVGAGGTRQRVRRDEFSGVRGLWPRMWNFLGIGYLERRTWNNATTNAIDGSISTLSGRTAAYRTVILQTADFRFYFKNDFWRGKPLNSDDDKCLTRYVYSLGWKIAIQFDPRAVLETTVETGYKYLEQCKRWGRAHWRGNFTVMENEKYWFSRQMLWGMYVIYFGSFLTPAVLWEGLMWIALYGAVGGTESASLSYILFGVFILVTKVVKYIPHFLRHPTDTIFIPIAVLFSYFHGFLNLYCLSTMTKTHWGSKKLGKEDDIQPSHPNGRVKVVLNSILGFCVAGIAKVKKPLNTEVNSQVQPKVQVEDDNNDDGDEYVFVVKHATPGHGMRFTVEDADADQPDVAVPGLNLKHVEKPQFNESTLQYDVAVKSELPSPTDEETENGVMGPLLPKLGEKQSGDEGRDEGATSTRTNSPHSSGDESVLVLIDSTSTLDDAPEEILARDAANKAACTGGDPRLEEIYDSLPPLERC